MLRSLRLGCHRLLVTSLPPIALGTQNQETAYDQQHECFINSEVEGRARSDISIDGIVHIFSTACLCLLGDKSASQGSRWIYIYKTREVFILPYYDLF